MLQSLLDQKKEYIEHLQGLLAVPIAERIYNIYLECQKKGLKQFQHELNQISKWNNYNIEQESKQIITKTKCTYIAKLLKVTIIVCVKIKFYEYKNKLKNLDIKIPNIGDFIHKCFINAAQYSWKNPYLFVQTNLKPAEIQNNLNIIEYNIKKSISKTITECINIQEIIEYLDEVMDKSMKKQKSKSKKIVAQTQKIADDSPYDNNRNQKIVKQENELDDESINSSDSCDVSDDNNDQESDQESDQENDHEDVDQTQQDQDDVNSENTNHNQEEDINDDSNNQYDSDSDEDIEHDNENKENIDNADFDVVNMNQDSESDSYQDDNSETSSEEDVDTTNITQTKDDIKLVNIIEEPKPIRKHKKSSFF